MAVGPVPWTAILAWCEFHGLDHEATQVMIHVIRMLDVERADTQTAQANLDKARGPHAAAARSKR